ncbi:hypothetical protein FQR65_LT20209 [Abscondita terminalis]|nr:hypothetical protein FQR65_LT20209 [Abscondita terminalis]
MNLTGSRQHTHLQQEKAQPAQSHRHRRPALPWAKIASNPRAATAATTASKAINEHLTHSEYPPGERIGSDFAKGPAGHSFWQRPPRNTPVLADTQNASRELEKHNPWKEWARHLPPPPCSKMLGTGVSAIILKKKPLPGPGTAYRGHSGIDEQGLNRTGAKQKERSPQSPRRSRPARLGEVAPHTHGPEIVGYDRPESEPHPRLPQVNAKGKDLFTILCWTVTPFYAGKRRNRWATRVRAGIGQRTHYGTGYTKRKNDSFIHLTAQAPENPESGFHGPADAINAS